MKKTDLINNIFINILRTKILLSLIILILFASCIKKESVKIEQEKISDFELKKSLISEKFPDYFSKLEDENLSDETKKYLKFLFSYMPLTDFADYEFEFWKRQVEFSILTKSTFSWADSIPEDIFMQYVLPPRINNENLDTARMVFFRELRSRFENKDFNAEQAVLEVNHWCNEHVIYKGTDERTISPLAIVRSGFGRCGEESTFLVTALRSVGIPARQVYTPRWVHTDDNHAWVEAWIDGNWYYLGACEPAPVLNTGWFDVPATKTMLVHTKRFGNKNDTLNKVLVKTKNFEWVNVLEKYAPVKILRVLVVNQDNVPIKGAKVNYQVYNYSEMYPLFSDKTNIFGYSQFTTGYGSIEIFATNGTNYTSYTVAPEEEGLIKIIISDNNINSPERSHYYPPKGQEVNDIDENLIKQNDIRIKKNERIRKQRELSLYNKYNGKQFVKVFNYDEKAISFLIKSRGNWKEIEQFLIEASYLKEQKTALILLEKLSEKDLRDTKANILSEHLKYALNYKNDKIDEEIFYNYVLNPRVEFEMLKTYRELIISSLDSATNVDLRNNPEKIIDYIKSKVVTELNFNDKKYKVDLFNRYNVPITPQAVNKRGIADIRSLKIYFAAFCRSLGIPARIDFATGFPQYYHKDTWHDVVLQKAVNQPDRGKVFFVSKDNLRDLKYRTNFAIAVLEDGLFKTVDLGWEIPISEFENGVSVKAGKYMLLTSLRLEDESVIVKREYFYVDKDEEVYINVELPIDENKEIAYEKFNHNEIYNSNNTNLSSDNIFGNSNYIAFIWLDLTQEPSKHILRDLENIYDELNKNKIKIVFLSNQKLNIDNPIFENQYTDTDFKLLYNNITCKVAGKGVDFPQIIMINKNSNILFKSSGYIINSGDMLLQNIE